MKLFKRLIKSLSLTISISLVLLLSSCSFILENLPFNLFLNEPEILVSYVTEGADNSYILNIKLSNITYDDITAIYVNDVKYQEFTNLSNENDEELLINFIIDVTFNGEDYLVYKINAIEINNKIVNFSNEFIIYKTIDNNIISLKKQSVVGIYSPKSRTWGSGVVIKEKEIINGPKTLYEYYILTNYHVVKDAKGANPYEIVFDNLNSKLTRNISLISYASETADLALLKVVTASKILKALDDEQFETFVPVNYDLYDPVFAIGSPSNGVSYDFNQVKGGYITKMEVNVTLKDDNKICTKGCHALQTSAIQGKGSSGGGVFDRNGNLIGLHFAGNDIDNISSEIPISIILEFLYEYFNVELLTVKKGEFSPFILLDSQPLLLL